MTTPFRRIGLLLALCAALLLPGLGRLTMSRQQELRVSLSARYMAEGGSWLIPRFRDQPRLVKPPLMYWLVATAFKAAQTTVSAAPARFPSVVAGTILILAIYLGGSRLVGRRRALLSALTAVTCLMFLRHARLAETDMTLSLFTSLAVFASYSAITGRTPVRGWVLAGVFAGLGFLTKGPAALAIPILAAVFFVAVEPRYRRHLATSRTLSAVALFLLIATPWYLAILLQGGAQSAIAMELRETFVQGDHAKPFYYYVYVLPKMMLPWSVLLPIALWAVWKYARHHAGPRFLLTWFITGFVTLSTVANKQDHYSVLLLAPSALLIGWLLGQLPMTRLGWMKKTGAVYLEAIIVVYAAMGIAFVALPFGYSELPALPCRIAGALLIGIGLHELFPNHSRAVVGRMLHIAAMTVIASIGYVFGLSDYGRPQSMIPEFAKESEPYTRGSVLIYALGARASQLEFYLGSKTRYATNFVEAWGRAEPGDTIAISSDAKRPFPTEGVPTNAAVDLMRGDLRCVLFVKPPPEPPPAAP